MEVGAEEAYGGLKVEEYPRILPARKVSTTVVPDVRRIPLGQIAPASGEAQGRIVPSPETPKPPVAAFDAAL